MVVKEYSDLDVWQRAYTLSLEIHKTSMTFPKTEQYALADQLRRSSKSVCANIAEGFAKQKASKTEFRRYLLIAQGSATEAHMWCRYCADLDYVDTNKAQEWQTEYEVINKMISSFHARIK